MITHLGGAWAMSTFGFIAAALMPLPFLLYKWGPELRAKSKYNRESQEMMGMDTEETVEHKEDKMGSGSGSGMMENGGSV